MTDRTGDDLDIWGDGRPTNAMEMRRRRCPLRVEGQCPPDCLACEEFLEEYETKPPERKESL